MEIEITDQNFAEYLAQNKPMMIDFSATWCGPCRRMAPIIEELAKKYDGQIIVGKVDVDDNPEITTQFGIQSIPTIIFFKEGKQLTDKSLTGSVPANVVETQIQSILG